MTRGKLILKFKNVLISYNNLQIIIRIFTPISTPIPKYFLSKGINQKMKKALIPVISRD